MARPLRTPRTVFIFCLLLWASLLAACTPAAEPAAAPAESAAETEASSTDNGQADQLRVAIIGDESTLTPYTYVTGYPGWNLLTLQYDTLYQLDADGVAQPWLATESTVSDDGLAVTLTLRDDVTWHDGEPFTADDVKFAFDYFQENAQGRFARNLRPVASTEVNDAGQVVLTLNAPVPSLELGLLADTPIIPQHVWQDVDNPAEHTFDDVTNVGTGPYRLVEYQPDQFYRFEANADYFAGAPAVQELVAIQFADDAGTLAALRGGEVDMIVRPISPEQIDLLTAVPDLAVASGPLFTTQMINYDVTRAPFDQLEVRRAMALAIDQQDIIDTVYLSTATPGNPGWTHPALPVYNSDLAAEYDPEARHKFWRKRASPTATATASASWTASP